MAAVTLDTLINEALAIADNATRDIKSAKRKIQSQKASDPNPDKKAARAPETFSFCNDSRKPSQQLREFRIHEFRTLTSRQASKAGCFRPDMSLRQRH